MDKVYRVVDLEGFGFMSDTHEKPLSIDELRERFWDFDDARTDKYEDFTADYIQETWYVEFQEVGGADKS